MQLENEAARALLDLARSTIRAAVEDVPPPAENGSPLEFPQSFGCFVSLHEIGSHRLRGCVGKLEADEPLHVTVPKMAAACLRDPRFEQFRVTSADLPRLQVEVTLLSPLIDCAGPEDFDLLQEGIVLQVGDESGCFLPQVARETGWARDRLLSRLAEEKLGVEPDAWRRPEARLKKFRTLLLGPEPLIQS